jgi:hypothetical protein
MVVPFQISLELYRKESVNEGYFKLSWLKIRLIHQKIPSDKRKEKPREEKGQKIDYKRVPHIISLFIESLPYTLNIFSAFLKSVHVKKISIDSTIGMHSAADTAVVGGYLWGISSIINILPNGYLNVKPDFHKEHLDGSFLIEIKIMLFWIIIELLKALTKKPVRSLVGELRKVG